MLIWFWPQMNYPYQNPKMTDWVTQNVYSRHVSFVRIVCFGLNTVHQIWHRKAIVHVVKNVWTFNIRSNLQVNQVCIVWHKVSPIIVYFFYVNKLFVDLVLTTDELFVPSPEYKGNDLTKNLFRKCVICKRNIHDPIYKPGVPTPNGYRPRCERCVKLMLLMVDSAVQHICKNLGY